MPEQEIVSNVSILNSFGWEVASHSISCTLVPPVEKERTRVGKCCCQNKRCIVTSETWLKRPDCHAFISSG